MSIAEADTPEMAQARSAWPELVYRLIEHYKWEPQHLCKGQSAAKFYECIRRQEVPLTFLLQLLFRLTSPATTSGLLKTFNVGVPAFPMINGGYVIQKMPSSHNPICGLNPMGPEYSSRSKSEQPSV
jgi:hypothetical protein